MVRETCLPRSEQLTRPTDFEIGFSDDKAIMGLLHHLKTLLGGVGKRLSIQQQAVAVDGAAPDPMDARRPIAFGRDPTFGPLGASPVEREASLTTEDYLGKRIGIQMIRVMKTTAHLKSLDEAAGLRAEMAHGPSMQWKYVSRCCCTDCPNRTAGHTADIFAAHYYNS